MNKINLIFSLFLSFSKILIIPSITFSITFFFKSSSICNSFILSIFIKKLIINSKEKYFSSLNFFLLFSILFLSLGLLLLSFLSKFSLSLFSTIKNPKASESSLLLFGIIHFSE